MPIKKLWLILLILLVSLAGGAMLFEQNKQLKSVVSSLSQPLTYTNSKHRYTLEVPARCSYGPLSYGCKQTAPEGRPEKCLCYLNAEDLDQVHFGAHIGDSSNLSQADLWFFFMGELGTGQTLVEWVKLKRPDLDIPDEPNAEIAGVPAIHLYAPASPQTYSGDSYFFAKDKQVFFINMVNRDDPYNAVLYEQIIESIILVD